MKADADWAAIKEERSHWRQDSEGAWHRVNAPKDDSGCDHCGGNMVKAKWSDGSITIQCHSCGRAVRAIRSKKTGGAELGFEREAVK